MIRYIIVPLVLLAMVSCSGDKDKGAVESALRNNEELPKVEIARVSVETVPQIVTYTATVEAYKTNNISASSPNRIKQILVDVGARVVKGQKLVELDNVNIDQLKVRLDNSEREYRRALDLLEIGAGTRQTVDQLKTELDASRRQYDNMVENTFLTAPINGVVTARNYDPGDMTGSQPILTVEQVQPVKVLVNVSENEYPKVHKGMHVNVTFDTYGDRVFDGVVDVIYPSVDPSTRTFTVEIVIPNNNSEILPGMFARVSMQYGVAEHVVVPDRAVVKQTGSGNKFVYVFNPSDSTVSYNQVQLGQRIDNSYELISGVADNSLVVITGQTRLAQGVKVEVIDRKHSVSDITVDSIK